MTEQLFQFIWQYKLFDIAAIQHTVQGESITILSVGILNTDEGPDFTNAKIKIGNTGCSPAKAWNNPQLSSKRKSLRNQKIATLFMYKYRFTC